VFDSSKKHGEPLKFFIGAGQVIKGWEIGVRAMRLGEKCELHIQPEYAYGAMGAPPEIPGNAKLIFTVELLKINDRQAPRWQMDEMQLVQTALRFKEDGNIKYKMKKFKEAEGLYKEAYMHIEHFKNDNSEVLKLKITLLVNTAVATNANKDFKESIENLNKALEFDGKHVKAHFLRAVA